jgi:hypothetical protein
MYVSIYSLTYVYMHINLYLDLCFIHKYIYNHIYFNINVGFEKQCESSFCQTGRSGGRHGKLFRTVDYSRYVYVYVFVYMRMLVLILTVYRKKARPISHQSI